MRQYWPRWPLVAIVAVAVVISGLAGAAARADQGAEEFVKKNANEVLQVLNDNSVPLSEKKQRFRTKIDEIADVPKVTRFVLGRYSRGADPGEMKAFSDVFRRYATSVYESRLGEYAGEILTVTGSTDRAPGDAIVHSTVSGGNRNEPLEVNWRVLTDAKGVHKVVDVEVLGVWLAINQRDEIVSIVQNNGGRIPAATAQLRSKLDEIDAATTGG